MVELDGFVQLEIYVCGFVSRPGGENIIFHTRIRIPSLKLKRFHIFHLNGIYT